MRFKSIESTTEITIYSITGQLVAKVQVAKSSAEQTIPVDISSLEPGIYSVKMQADKHTAVRQLIKQ